MRTGGMARSIRAAILTVACAAFFMPPAVAQTQQVQMAEGDVSVRVALSEIRRQTGRRFAFSEYFNIDRTVKFDPPTTTLDAAVKTIAGNDHTYSFDDNYIFIYRPGEEPAAIPVLRNITGLIRDDKTGEPLKNAQVEIFHDNRRLRTTTDASGYFIVNDVPAGQYIAKVTSADGGTPYYAEVSATTSNARAEIRYKEFVPDTAAEQSSYTLLKATSITESDPVTTYYYYEKEGDVTKANPRSSMTLLPEGAVYSDYKPKAALKTNSLMWATTTPNIGLEFSLGRKWTLDLAYAYNPWHWDDGSSYRFWLVQPEVRYWFCNRFEKHFIGLHGIYGQFNMGKFDRPFPDTFQEHRYKGYGYGAGLAYGYHLPIAKRWALEFTVGAGWVHLDYDKYRCGACDEHEGRKSTDYFGPTKAGINLIFFIK